MESHVDPEGEVCQLQGNRLLLVRFEQKYVVICALFGSHWLEFSFRLKEIVGIFEIDLGKEVLETESVLGADGHHLVPV